jgi:hypothetical protein
MILSGWRSPVYPYQYKERRKIKLKKTIYIIGSILIAILVAGIFVTSGVFAQETTPPTQEEATCPPPGFERGMRPGRGFGVDPIGLEAAAQALGITSDELSAKLKDGMTLTEIVQEAGVDEQVFRDAIDAAHADAMRAKIEQDVTDGTITQDHADWLLQGLEKGYLKGHRFGFGFDKHGFPPSDTDSGL